MDAILAGEHIGMALKMVETKQTGTLIYSEFMGTVPPFETPLPVSLLVIDFYKTSGRI